MTRTSRPVADPVAGISYLCELCGGRAHAYSEDDGRTVDVWDLCRSCNAAFEDLAQALEAARPAAPQHNLRSVWCRTAEAVGEFPVDGEVCPLCQPDTIPGQLELDDRATVDPL